MGKKLAVMIVGVLLLSMFSVLRLALPDSSVQLSDPGWTKTYGGARDDLAFTLIQTSDGGYALAGYTLSYNVGLADFYFVKTDGSGNMQWNRSYGGIFDEIVNSIVQTSDGGYALAGYSSSFSQTDDCYLVKIDSSGNIQWSKTYGGQGFDFANAVVRASDGGYVLAGQTDSFGAGGYDFYLIKTDSSGNVQWSRTYGGTKNDEAWSVARTSDGGYALAGFTKSFGAGGSDFWLVKTNALGNMQWNKTYGGPIQDVASCVVQTSDGGYALAGETYSYNVNSQVFFVKTDGSGNVQLSKMYGGTDSAGASSVTKTSDGGYALAGHIEYFGVDSSDAWLVKTDSSGNMQWSKTYGGTQDDRACSVVQTSDGKYVLAGYTNSFGAGGYDFYLVNTDASPVHDVAVTSVHSLKTVVGKSSVCKVNVTVRNWGDFIEVFNVTTWAMIAPPATSIQNTSIAELSPGEARTLAILWNTTGWAYGNYTVGAAASAVPDEIDTANNVYADGPVIITISGDVNTDKRVNVLDLILIATRLGHHASEYTPYSHDWYAFNNCDLDGDGNVNVLDLIACATHLGQHWP